MNINVDIFPGATWEMSTHTVLNQKEHVTFGTIAEIVISDFIFRSDVVMTKTILEMTNVRNDI